MENDKLFDFRNSSSTFYRLMRKYHKKNNKKIFLNNKGYIANAIEEKREKLQLEEKDDMFIYKETKNIANMNELLLNLYGNKAKKRFYDVSRIFSPIKIDRKLFSYGKNDEKDNDKENNNNLTEKCINKKGIMKLPLIFRNIISYNEKEKKSTKNLLTTGNIKSFDRKKILKLLSNKKENLKEDKTKKEKVGIDALKSNLNDKNKSKGENINRNNANNLKLYYHPISKSHKNILLTQNQKNKTKKDAKNKENDINKENNIIKIKNELTLNEDYISSLTNFKDELVKEEKQKMKYFNKNDYGCKIFKEKYNYLSNKYFN